MPLMWPLVGIGALFALAAASKKNPAGATPPGTEPVEPLEPVAPVGPGAGRPGFTTQPVTVSRPTVTAPPVARSPGTAPPVVHSRPEFGAVSPGQPTGPAPVAAPVVTVPPELSEPISDAVDAVEGATGIELPDPGELLEEVEGVLPPGVIPPGLGDLIPTPGEVIEAPPIITEDPNVDDEPVFTTQPVEQRSPEVLEPVEPVEPPPVQTEPVERVSPREALAAEVFAMISEGKPVQDKGLLKSFQRQEGLKQSGVYGMGSGLGLIKYGFVPPKPFSWPSAKAARDRDQSRWRGEMLTMARRDPQRGDEWREASRI